MTKRRRIRFSLFSLFVITTLVAGSIGAKRYWEYRKEEARLAELIETKLPEAWINTFLAHETPLTLLEAGIPTQSNQIVWMDGNISVSDRIRILDYAARNFSTNQRLGALRILIKFPVEKWQPIMQSLAKDCEDGLVRKTALKYLAAYGTDATFFLRFTKDPDAEFRAIAIDGFGITKTRQTNPLFTTSYYRGENLTYGLRNFNPHTDVSTAESASTVSSEFSTKERHQVATWMTSAKTAAERDAAARILACNPPPNYQLRLAEWGVWINAEGNLQLVESVLDEIPDFVHRTVDNPNAVVFGTFKRHVNITKPILHLSASQPLAINLTVQIRGGTPCFAYPRPDRIQIGRRVDSDGDGQPELVQVGSKLNKDFDTSRPFALNVFPLWKIDESAATKDQGKSKTKNRVFGHPAFRVQPFTIWESSPLRTEEYSGLFADNGLRWKLLVVTPKEYPWMVKPKIEDEHEWWKILRDVPSNWVTSRGETERFVYYDGPTKLPAGFSVEQEGTTIKIASTSSRKIYDGLTLYPPEKNDEHHPARIMAEHGSRLPAFVIRCNQGKTTGIEIPTFGYGSYDLAELPSFDESELRKRLGAAIVKAGLTKSETDGLLGAWESGFFRDEGARLISFLSPSEYENYCPLQVKPPPTEMARVGLMLSVLE